MACSKCAKKRQPSLATVSLSPTPVQTWVVRVPDFEGVFTTLTKLQIPLESGLYYSLRNSDVLRLKEQGFTVEFYNEQDAVSFNTYNKIAPV